MIIFICQSFMSHVISSSIFEIFNFKSYTHLVNTVVSQERRKVCIKEYSRMSFPKLSPVLIIVIQHALQHLSQVALLILPDEGSKTRLYLFIEGVKDTTIKHFRDKERIEANFKSSRFSSVFLTRDTRWCIRGV